MEKIKTKKFEVGKTYNAIFTKYWDKIIRTSYKVVKRTDNFITLRFVDKENKIRESRFKIKSNIHYEYIKSNKINSRCGFLEAFNEVENEK